MSRLAVPEEEGVTVTSIRWPNEGQNWTDFNEQGRRERIATVALQGMLASGIKEVGPDGAAQIARAACRLADALIAELDKPKEQK